MFRSNSMECSPCEPKIETQVAECKKRLDSLNNLLDALGKAPYLDIDSRTGHSFIGAVYIAMKAEDERFTYLLDKQMKHQEKGE